MNKLDVRKMVVVDLYTGSYNKERTGHELYNLDRNPVDGYFYGYCPPHDGINISVFGANRTDEFVDDILVVYVTKKKDSNNREIIAFCLNARVFRKGQFDDKLCRNVKDKDGEESVATYSIKSNNLEYLKNKYNKFEININEYNNRMFRSQRFYGGKYPELDKKIIAYIESVIENREFLDNDNSDEQEEIQRSEPATQTEIQYSPEKPLNIVDSNQGKIIAKNNRISKSALIEAKYTCVINQSHKTFITTNGTPYMEGHHLIPCTVSNSELFMDKYHKNIDCVENIVCLCPNCHREVHCGEWNSKSQKIRKMFTKQKEKLVKAGLLIDEEELLNLYK